MSIWHWLGNNSSQIQALAGVAAVIVAAIVGLVAWKQKQAAEAQAAAAMKQTIAAEVQAEAARQQVAAAKQQTETSLVIADKQMAPYISLVRSSQVQNAQNATRTIEVHNTGTGPALNIVAKYNDGLPGNDDLKAPNSSLMVGSDFSLWVTDLERAAKSGISITYETVIGTKYALDFQWNGLNSVVVNQRLSKLS